MKILIEIDFNKKPTKQELHDLTFAILAQTEDVCCDIDFKIVGTLPSILDNETEIEFKETSADDEFEAVDLKDYINNKKVMVTYEEIE